MKKRNIFKIIIFIIFLQYFFGLVPFLIRNIQSSIQNLQVPVIIIAIVAITASIGVLLNFFSLYFLVFNFFGFVRAKREYTMQKPKSKFAILVFAHNEENVIESSIQTLLKVNYPKDLYKIYIVADNCTDKTIPIAEKYLSNNLEIIKRVNTKLRGKQYAVSDVLNEALPKLEKTFTSDAILFLDADNHINTEFLNEMNSDFISNPQFNIIQGYLGVKNPESNLVSKGYAATYNVFNRFYQQGKREFGINSHIGGTGFALRTHMIYKYRWQTNSLTEDYEMAVKFTCAGEKIMWNHFAIVYDEKPTKIKASVVQRLRWVRGHWQVVFANFGMILRSRKQMGIMNYIDQIAVAISLGKSINYAISILIGILIAIITKNIVFLVVPIVLFSLTYILLIFQIYSILHYEKRESKIKATQKIFSYMIATLYFNFTFIPLHLIGLISWKNKDWVRTEHSFNEISEVGK